MNEIKCPHCGEVFTVDESGYAAILNQVRDQEFQRELADRERLLDESRAKEIELACAQVRDEMGRQLSESREKSAAELAEEQRKLAAQTEQLKAQANEFKLSAQAEKADLEKQLAALRAQLAVQAGEAETARKLAVSDAGDFSSGA